MPIDPSTEFGVFGLGATTAMDQAYEAACRAFLGAGLPYLRHARTRCKPNYCSGNEGGALPDSPADCGVTWIAAREDVAGSLAAFGASALVSEPLSRCSDRFPSAGQAASANGTCFRVSPPLTMSEYSARNSLAQPKTGEIGLVSHSSRIM